MTIGSVALASVGLFQGKWRTDVEIHVKRTLQVTLPTVPALGHRVLGEISLRIHNIFQHPVFTTVQTIALFRRMKTFQVEISGRNCSPCSPSLQTAGGNHFCSPVKGPSNHIHRSLWQQGRSLWVQSTSKLQSFQLQSSLLFYLPLL